MRYVCSLLLAVAVVGVVRAAPLDNVGEFCLFAFVRELQVDVNERQWVGTAVRPAMPTLLRGSLRLPEGERAELLDAAGRRLLELNPGANDVHLLAPGVYLIRPESGRAVTKIVVRKQ